jgi:hypothetical protein
MATVTTAPLSDIERSHTLNVMRLLVAGGVTAAVIFVFCWTGAFLPYSSPTHAYIGLFTYADINSGQALAEGTCWSFLFGAIVGAVFALIYNATAAFGRR